MNLESTIKETFLDVLDNTDKTLLFELNNDSVLLETGMDSLGFAILVARLDEELGYDPFTLMEDAIYPTTFKEFIDIYNTYRPK